MAQVSLRNVSKVYPGGIKAVERVNLGVENKEFVVLVGPSGCGKSTLLKAVAGFMRPVEGTIRLHGQTVDRPGADRMMVFQEFDQSG
jgi:NitT/TauT family transport system ATP-binding protein